MEKPKILTKEEIDSELENLPEWSYKDNKISREFTLESFVDSIIFVTKMAFFFEKIDHHAEIQISSKKVVFDLQRFDVGGKVTDLDIATAYEAEKVYEEIGSSS